VGPLSRAAVPCAVLEYWALGLRRRVQPSDDDIREMAETRTGGQLRRANAACRGVAAADGLADLAGELSADLDEEITGSGVRGRDGAIRVLSRQAPGSGYSEEFGRLLRRAGLRRITLHDSRHTTLLAGEEEWLESAPSRTAMFAAVSRGLFRLETASPWVLDDGLALVLVGPVWQQLRDQFDPLFPGPARREARAAVCTRSRYAEDRLAAGAFGQYVILGAGLDSFAWRRPDLLGSLTVFEVDHPASQAWKLERVRDLGLPLSDSQVFVPADFEAEPVQDALGAAGFDWAQPAMFCWTGVAPYLTAQAIESTLRTIAAAAPGSEVVFSYRAEDSVLDDVGTEYARTYTPIAASVGEPLQPGWPVSEIERLISRCGLKVVDHPARVDLQRRYFAGRADGLRPYTFETLVAARVT
jgi:methyltransferase (TIGR00027 family)